MYYVKIDNGRGDMVLWTTTRTESEVYAVRDDLVNEHDFYPCDIFIEER